MAAVTHAVSTASSSNLSEYVSGTFTPAADDLLVVFVAATDTAAAGTLESSVTALTFSKVGHALKNSSVDRLYCFVADRMATAELQTVTFKCTGDAATGAVIVVARVSGLTKCGLAAIRQSAKQDNQAGGAAPAPAFSGAAQTGNPTLGAVINAANPAGMTAPASWTELNDTGYASPTTGLEYVHRNSGFTGTTITWGSSSASAFGSFIIELDTAAGATAGDVDKTFLTVAGVDNPAGAVDKTFLTVAGVDNPYGAVDKTWLTIAHSIQLGVFPSLWYDSDVFGVHRIGHALEAELWFDEDIFFETDAIRLKLICTLWFDEDYWFEGHRIVAGIPAEEAVPIVYPASFRRRRNISLGKKLRGGAHPPWRNR